MRVFISRKLEAREKAFYNGSYVYDRHAKVHAGSDINGKWVPEHVQVLRYTLEKE